MRNVFGDNFNVTKQMAPEDFFKTMFDTMTQSLEDSRLSIDSEVSSILRSSTSSIKEIIDEGSVSVLEVDAEYTVPQFPKLEASKLKQKDFWLRLHNIIDD